MAAIPFRELSDAELAELEQSANLTDAELAELERFATLTESDLAELERSANHPESDLVHHENGATEFTYLDLIELREAFLGWSQDLSFSEAFRGLVQAAAEAIAQCDEGDETTHPPVKAALEKVFLAADAEASRMDALSKCFAELDFGQDATAWRQTLGELVPLLSDAHVLGLRLLMLEAAADFPTASA